MSQSEPDPDSSSLTRSTEDPELDRGDSSEEIPWQPPVIAAIAGALSVAIFVIYAISIGPGTDEISNDELPPGYVLVTEDSGARVESLASAPSSIFAFVSTVVPASSDAATVRQLDVAFWDLVTPTGTFLMQDQFDLAVPTGSGRGRVTVAFPADAAADPSRTDAPETGGEIRAFVVETAVAESAELDLSPDLPAELVDFRIEVGDGSVVVIDVLQITEKDGYVQWRVEGGRTARLDVVVSLAGTGESDLVEAALVPEYSTDSMLDISNGTEPVPLLYSFGSQYRLKRIGTLAGNGDLPTGIRVEFRVSAVTSVGDAVTLPIG